MTREDRASSAGETGGKGTGSDQVKPHQRLLRSKGFIPTVVVVALAAFVLLSPRMAGSPPRLESITPTRGKPGDVMIVTGHNFGQHRDTSEVRISGVSPTSTDYGEWTDTRISVTIPDEAASGIVYVITKSGRSSGLLFINQGDIPLPASGSARPGDPYIVNNSDNPIQPSAARVGDTITIYGMNFGLEKGTSEVYFTWAGQQSPSSGSLDLSNLLPARDYNLDYISWSDREIKLRVPDGAASGNVLVTSDKGRSNAAYFVVNKGPARRLSPLSGSIRSSTPWTSRSPPHRETTLSTSGCRASCRRPSSGRSKRWTRTRSRCWTRAAPRCTPSPICRRAGSTRSP